MRNASIGVCLLIACVLPAWAQQNQPPAAPAGGSSCCDALQQQMKAMEDRIILLEGQVRLLKEQLAQTQTSQTQAPGAAPHTPGSQCPAVHVSANHSDSVRRPGTDQGLRNREAIQQPQARPANIERVAVLSRQQPRVQLRRERRIVMMRFARGNNPVEFLCSAGRRAQRLFCGFCAQRQFRFVLGGVRQRLNARALPQLADRHAKRAVHFLGAHRTRAEDG